MPIGGSDCKTSFSHLLIYIYIYLKIANLLFLKDIVCCSLATWQAEHLKILVFSATGMNKRQWPGLMSMTPYSLNQYSEPRCKMKGREKREPARRRFFFFFFWVNKRIRVLYRHSGKHWSELKSPWPAQMDLTTWSNIRLQVRCFIHRFLCFSYYFDFP